MFAPGIHPRIRQNRLKLFGDRRRLQEARAAYNTRLRFEPLEDRRLLSVATWTGAGLNDLWTNAANWGGTAPVAGDNLIFPAGALQTANVNDFAAGTAFGSIEIAGDGYSLTGNQLSLAANATSEGTGNSLGLDLQLSADEGIVNANTSGATFTVSGAIDLNGHNLSVSASNYSGISELDGAISGTGGLTIGGSGQSVLNAANSYAGVTTVNSGTLVVENASALGAAGTGNETDVENNATLQLNGSFTVAGELLTSSSSATISSVGDNVWTGDMTLANELDVDVNGGNSLRVDGNITAADLYNYDGGQLILDGSANAIQYYVGNYGVLEVDGTLSLVYYYVYNYGTLQGTGTINSGTQYAEPIYNYGTLIPGTASLPGILNVNNIDFGSGGNFNVLLNGATAGTDYAQLDVTGSVTAGGNLNVSLGYTPTIGDSFIIVKNEGAQPISGTFNGLPQGGLLVVGSDVFQISYTGGDGGDIVLTSVEADIWTGADNGVGGSNDWSDQFNWLGDVAPVAGDNLIFPAGALQTANVNDFAAGTAFGSIEIAGDGYSLTGNQLSLAANATSEGTGNSLGLDLQLSADEGIVNANTSGATFTVSGAIDLNGHNLSVSASNYSGISELDGAISGTGGLTIGGSGQSVLNAANSYAGVTTVNSGTLVVENASALGAAGTGNETDVENNATLQLNGSFTVAGELLTSSSSATISSVGDNVWTGDMTLANELDVDVNGGNSLRVDGNITAADLYNYDGGQLILDGSANAIQYYVGNYGVLEVDGTLSLVYYYVYNYGTLQGTGTINSGTQYAEPIYNYGTLIPGTASLPGILNVNNIDFGSGGNFNVLLNGAGTAGTDYSQLDVTGSVTAGGNLNVSLGYTPTIGDSFIIVKNEGAQPISGTFNGLPQGGLLVVGSDVFQISYTGGDGGDIVLTSVEADIWTGADNGVGGSNDWSDQFNWLGDVAPVAGDNLIFPAGALQTANVNDFAAGTAFGSIEIAGDGYSLTGNQLSLAANVTSEGTGNSLGLDLQLSADEGIVNANTAGATFTVSGAIDLNGHNLSVSASNYSGITEFDGVISGTGGLTIGGSGQSVLNAANSYAGVTTVNSGTLVVENASALGAAGTGNETDVENNATLQLNGSFTVAGELLTSSSSATISSVGDNVWTGDMTLASELDVDVNSGNSLRVDGNVTAADLYNYDGGQLILDGSANAIQYYVGNYGVLEVDGTLSLVYYYVYNYGTLQGTGTINSGTQYAEPIYNYGTLIPGTASLPGILNVNNIDFGSGGNFNVLLNGATAGTDYAQLDVTGSVTAGGNLNVSLGYTPTIGDTYMIIKNDGTDAVSGTFSGLSEGGQLTVGGYLFQISYVGGTGNDVVLTALTGNPDTTPPTATIDQALGQNDPTNASPIHFTVVFSKMVNGFTASAIDFSGSTDAGSLTATLSTSDQITFDVAVTGMTDDGPVTISFAAGAATDGGGLQSEAPTVIDNTVTYDITPPTVTLGSPSATITAGGPITYTVTYADANFNSDTLTAADVTLNSTGDATGTVSVSFVDSTTELVTISNITGNGTLGISLASGTASDLAGNLAPAAGPSDTFIVDNVPTVSGINPTVGPSAGGTVVTITGTNLAGAMAVNFGTIVVTTFISDSDTQIVLNSPAGSVGTVNVTVVTPGGTSPISAADQFTYEATSGLGLFNPTTSVFYLRNTTSLQGPSDNGYADTVFAYGPGGLPAGSQLVPLAGDWNGDGRTPLACTTRPPPCST